MINLGGHFPAGNSAGSFTSHNSNRLEWQELPLQKNRRADRAEDLPCGHGIP